MLPDLSRFVHHDEGCPNDETVTKLGAERMFLRDEALSQTRRDSKSRHIGLRIAGLSVRQATD
jgi:hypothetical protein